MSVSSLRGELLEGSVHLPGSRVETEQWLEQEGRSLQGHQQQQRQGSWGNESTQSGPEDLSVLLQTELFDAVTTWVSKAHVLLLTSPWQVTLRIEGS